MPVDLPVCVCACMCVHSFFGGGWSCMLSWVGGGQRQSACPCVCACVRVCVCACFCEGGGECQSAYPHTRVSSVVFS